MAENPVTSDFPLRPIGEGDTLVQVFRSAAQQGAAEGEEHGTTPGPRSPPALRRSAVPSLQRRLYEADGQPVRLGRYDVIRCVGSGGMGVVYEAVSVGHGHRVALKTLRWMTSLGLSRFKNEFRSLCGVAHPNLVSLYELGAADGEWFFTMELVEGQSFLEHVQADGARPLGSWEYLGETFDESVPEARLSIRAGRDEEARLPTVDESGVMARRTFHEGRLRAALRQLASAVARLHELGKLHRDLNPGNVLVTREGRVVVLDFGLISDQVRRPGAPYDVASGTPAYMSPEQAAGKPAAAASDWYGFGVMLFEALTGQLPFTGSSLRILTNKRHQTAPAPSTLLHGLPPDLDELCVALLRRAPEDRPGAADILRALGARPFRARAPRMTAPGSEGFFAGRRAELAELDAALEAAGDRPVTVVVRGPPGMGKSALVAHFLDRAAVAGDAVVLRGASSARESIPYRLLDAAVDSLAAHLATLPRTEVEALLPPDARDLCRVFPVLEGVDAIADLPPPATDAADDRAAFACLRGLLGRLARTHKVVLAIDDAHLGDAEGAERLAEILAPPGAPGLLLVLVDGHHRHRDREGAEARDGTERRCSPDAPLPHGRGAGAWWWCSTPKGGGDVREIVLGPLAHDEARALALQVLPGDLENGTDVAEAIASASEGSPLAVEELARHVADAEGEVSLDEAVGARLGGLPEPALRLAEIVAAAPEPLERGLLFAVAGAGSSGDAALAVLAAHRVVRSEGMEDGDRVRIHDERLRAVLAARTAPAAARRIHLDLGRAQAARDGVDPAAAAASFLRAGEAALAAEHLAVAAERAAAGGDHERAADLWERAVKVTPSGAAGAQALSLRRAGALAAAGRSAAAAAAYLEGIAGAPPAEALERRRRAAEQLLVAGHFDEGLAALRPVLSAHDVRWPRSSRLALWTLGARIVELRLRGTALPERPGPPAAMGVPARRKIETLWSAGRALSTIDPIRSAVLVIEALLAALEAGDAHHATIALSFVGSTFVYHGGAGEEARGLALIEEASRFARRSGDPYLLGFSWFCSGLARLCAGRFREALARVEEAVGLLEAGAEQLAWERLASRTVSLQALFELGAVAERTRRAEAWLREARARDDWAGEVQASLAVAFGILAAGDAPRARDLVQKAMARGWQGGFGLQHQMALWVEVSSLLYDDQPSTARSKILDAWPQLAASQLLRIQLLRIEALHLRGLTAVAAGGADLRLAEADAALLARERRPHALAAASLLRAGIAWRKGQIARAVAGLAAAARDYASAEMAVHAAAARRARGVLLGGPEGRALVAEADAVLSAEGVRDGARWAAMYTAVRG